LKEVKQMKEEDTAPLRFTLKGALLGLAAYIILALIIILILR